jgi:hypothetical protein
MRFRFRIRSFVLLVILLGMLLGIGALTRENRRLRTALAVSEKKAASTQAIIGSLMVTVNGDRWEMTRIARATKSATPMPNGPDVFVGRRP